MCQLCAKCANFVTLARKHLRRTDVRVCLWDGCLSHRSSWTLLAEGSMPRARVCARIVYVLGRSGELLAPPGVVGRFGDLRLRWRRSVPRPDHGLAGSLLGAAICWQPAGVFSRA